MWWAIFDKTGFIRATCMTKCDSLKDDEQQVEVPTYVDGGRYRIDMQTLLPVEIIYPPELIVQILSLMFKAGIATVADINPDDLVKANIQLTKVGQAKLE